MVSVQGNLKRTGQRVQMSADARGRNYEVRLLVHPLPDHVSTAWSSLLLQVPCYACAGHWACLLFALLQRSLLLRLSCVGGWP